MSHNVLKINNNNFDQNNNINLSMESILNNSSSSNGNVIKKTASGWESGNIIGNLSTSLSLKFGLLSDFSSTAWGGGNYFYDIGDYLSYRQNNGKVYSETGYTYNTITTATAPVTNSKWCNSVDIPTAGKYLCTFSAICDMSGGDGDVTYRFRSNSGYFGAKVFLKSSGNNYGGIACGIVDAIQNDIIALEVVSQNGPGSNDIHEQNSQYSMCFTVIKID